MHKYVGIMLIAVLVLSILILAKPVNSEITKPSVPEFAIKLVDNSYDVPTTYSTDPYTGVNVTHPSHRIENRTLELVIKNQPFVSTNIDGWNTSFYYNVRIKGHFSKDWLTLYSPTVTPYLAQANSESTVIPFQYTNSSSGYSVGPLSGLTLNAQIDFQVQALIGYVHREYNASATSQIEMYPWTFEGETSAWSNTQTLTITETAPTPITSQSPTATFIPSDSPNVVQLGLDWTQTAIVILLFAIAILLASVVVLLYRRRNKT